MKQPFVEKMNKMNSSGNRFCQVVKGFCKWIVETNKMDELFIQEASMKLD